MPKPEVPPPPEEPERLDVEGPADTEGLDPSAQPAKEKKKPPQLRRNPGSDTWLSSQTPPRPGAEKLPSGVLELNKLTKVSMCKSLLGRCEMND